MIRERDWSTHPLDHPQTWPEGLRVALGIVLNSPESMILAWGPDLTFFFNDTYFPMLGPRLPWAMGAPFKEVWSDAWAQAKPIIDEAFAGRSNRYVDLPWKLAGDRGAEDTWWSFSYSRVLDGKGAVAGLFIVTNETTDRVLGRAAESRNRQILDSAVDHAIIATDLHGRVTRWNEGARRVLGWTEDEMLGQTVERFFTPEDVAADRPAVEMKMALNAGRANNVRWHMRKSGERFWGNGEMTPLRDADHDVIGFVKVLRDLTEQRLVEEALRSTEAQLRRAQQAGGIGLFAVGSDGVMQATTEFFRLYGIKEREGVPSSAFERLVLPEDADRVSTMATRAQGEVPLDVEYRIRRLDTGEVRWIARKGEIQRDERGRFTRFVGVAHDITDQVAVRHELLAERERLARLNATLEQRVAERTAERDRVWRLSADIMLVAGFDGIITAANPAWHALLGWTEAEIVGTDLFELIHPDDLERTIKGARELSMGGSLARFENRYRHKNGSYRWLSWGAVPGDGLINAVGRDVTTEREQAEALNKAEEQLRQSQKMEAVGQLTGGIAHDFNNLLTGITGSLDLLNTRIAQGRIGDIERYTTAAQGAAKRAAALTHRLLAFSRRQTLDPRPTDVNRLVHDMAELIRRTVGPSVTIETVAMVGLWPTLVDPGQLENALLNLCINARDAMPEGGRITIETANRWMDQVTAAAQDLPAGQYISMCVSDTGTGMTPDIVARAFDPFFTTKPTGQGTGLGLSMIYGFARQSGGHVRIYSEVGQGTMVCVYLPRHHGEVDAAEQAMGSVMAQRADVGETVLVVDDEPSVRMLVMETLEDLGYAAIEAADGPSGLKVLQSDARIDLLVSDVGLPGGMNGRQMVDVARLKRPDLKVLFITGYAENAVVGNGHLDAGMHVMTKPFAMEALAGRIKELISPR